MGHMWRSLPWLNEPSHLLSCAHIQKCSRACSDPSSPDPESQSPDSSSHRQMVSVLPAESRPSRHVNLLPVSTPRVLFTVTHPCARSQILGKMTHSLWGKMYISKNCFLLKQGSFWERILRIRTDAKTQLAQKSRNCIIRMCV